MTEGTRVTQSVSGRTRWLFATVSVECGREPEIKVSRCRFTTS